MATHKGYKGKFTPSNPSKYKGNVDDIIFRSLLERRYMVFFDLEPRVIEWGSETLVIPYVFDGDGKVHRYFTDMYVKMRMDDGTIKKLIIEIKPEKFTQQPIPKKRMTKAFQEECIAWVKNQNKWTAAKQYAQKNNAEFIILTEKDINAWQGIRNK